MAEEYELSAVELAFAGAGSGAFTRFTCQPFDVVKIRFQLQITRRIDSKYQSIAQTVIKIGREEGIRALWKGHVPAQALSVVYGAVQFYTYEKLTRQKNTAVHFVGGAVSGVAAVLASYPLDVLRTRLVAQSEPKIYAGMIDAAQKIMKMEGPRTFFKGITPALISTTPLSGVIFGFNFILTSTIRNITGDVNIAGALGCGAIAGVCGKAAVYPMDVIKKRMQASGMPEGTTAVPLLRASGLFSAVRATWNVERFRGLYKGFAPSLIKAAVSNAVYLGGYDQFRKFLMSIHRN